MRTLNSHSCLGKTPIIRDKITLIMITRTGSHSNQSPRISIDTRDRSALTLLLSSSQAPQRPLMLQKRRSHHFLITSDSFKGVGDRKSYYCCHDNHLHCFIPEDAPVHPVQKCRSTPSGLCPSRVSLAVFLHRILSPFPPFANSFIHRRSLAVYLYRLPHQV